MLLIRERNNRPCSLLSLARHADAVHLEALRLTHPQCGENGVQHQSIRVLEEHQVLEPSALGCISNPSKQARACNTISENTWDVTRTSSDQTAG